MNYLWTLQLIVTYLVLISIEEEQKNKSRLDVGIELRKMPVIL